MSDAGSPASAAGQPEENSAPKSQTTLDDLKRMFNDSRTLMQDARKESSIDRDYYDGHQLTADEIQILRSRGQPDIVINRVRRGVDGILGVVDQGKSDPRAYMRNPPDPSQEPQQPSPMMPGMPGAQAPQQQQQPKLDAGDVASMTLRFVADANHFHQLKMDVLENMCVEGDGACIIEWADNDVLATQIRWEEYFYDPRSRRPDFQDKRYDGVAKWMYADKVAALYPKFKQAILGTVNGSGTMFDTTWEDRPENLLPWIDSRQKRLMVVECYYLEAGQWWRCVYIASTILEQGPSPYKDDKGRLINPIEAQAAYRDAKNRPYGIVRDMRGPQDEINMRRSKALHEINSRQVQQTDANAPPVDVNTVRGEAARPDGVIPPGWQVVTRQDVVANNLEMLTEAKAEIERMGPNPAILGRQGADSSGRAQQIRQQAGLVELARVLGRFSDWELRVYKQMWARCRQFYTDPKWIRVASDEGAPQYVRINEPAPVDPATGQPIAPPKNHIAEMDVDVVVDTVPDTATLQQEIFQDLVQLASAYVGTPQQVPFKVLLQMSSLPKRRELIDMLEREQGIAAQAQAPVQQLQFAGKTAEIDKTKSETMRNLADAKAKDVAATVDAMHGHMTATGAQPPPNAPPPPPPGVPGADGLQPPQG